MQFSHVLFAAASLEDGERGLLDPITRERNEARKRGGERAEVLVSLTFSCQNTLRVQVGYGELVGSKCASRVEGRGLCDADSGPVDVYDLCEA